MTSSGEVVRRRRNNPPRSTPPSSSSSSSSTDGGGGGGGRTMEFPDPGGPPPARAAAAAARAVRNEKYDECAWFVVLLAAASYFVVTRRMGGDGGGGLMSSLARPYDVVASSVGVAIGAAGGGGGGGGEGDGGGGGGEGILRSIFHVVETPPLPSSSPRGGDAAVGSKYYSLTLQARRRLEVVLSSPPDLDVAPPPRAAGDDRCSGPPDEGHPLDGGGGGGGGGGDGRRGRGENSIASPPLERRPPPTPQRPYFSFLSSTAWVHDPDLGRGYLLLSDVGRSGRIWRWEVGGGPIAIGRSLHMERSGCRSGLWVDGTDDHDHDYDYDDDDDDDDDDDEKKKKKTTNGTCPENLFSGGGLGSMTTTTTTTTRSSSSTSSSSSSPPRMLGSASVAVEPDRDADRASAGRNLIVAEWGERRIVRVEGETGARTPLVTSVPRLRRGDDEDDDDEDCDVGVVEGGGGEGGGVIRRRRRSRRRRRRRVYRPNHLTYTPFGDLIFSDTFDEGDDRVGAVYRRKEAVHVAPIPVERSRDAHGWTGTTGEDDRDDDDDDDDDGGDIDILFRTVGSIEGVALGLDFSNLYVLVSTQTGGGIGWRKMLYMVPIGSNEEDEEDVGDDGVVKTNDGMRGVTLLHEMTSSDCEDDTNSHDIYHSVGSKLAVDEKGVVYLVSCPSSVTILSVSQGGVQLVGTLSLDAARIRRNGLISGLTSVGFGEDGYLYITSVNELMRVKSRSGIWEVKCYLVHKLVVVGFNNGGHPVVTVGLDGSPKALICIYASIVKGGASQLPEVHLRFVHYWGEVLFLHFEFHSWKLGANVWIGSLLFLF
ncbi:hypothetical protein ACHAW5_000106 [Stephanodiscus triporus]|uniref:Uncharacterized protein n=1 Tax=Stephanodiscus triporus TaxID=2934178 RepID=A0ABD3N5Z3_9STRA